MHLSTPATRNETLSVLRHAVAELSANLTSHHQPRSLVVHQVTKLLTRITPNCVTLTPPPAEPALTAWKKMLEGDVATMRELENRATLAKTLAK